MSRTGGNTGWVTYYGRDGKIFVAYCHTCRDQDPATVSRDRESDWTLEADGDVWFVKRGKVRGVLALLHTERRHVYVLPTVSTSITFVCGYCHCETRRVARGVIGRECVSPSSSSETPPAPSSREVACRITMEEAVEACIYSKHIEYLAFLAPAALCGASAFS